MHEETLHRIEELDAKVEALHAKVDKLMPLAEVLDALADSPYARMLGVPVVANVGAKGGT